MALLCIFIFVIAPPEMNRVAGIEAAGAAHLQDALPAPWAGSVLPVSHMAQIPLGIKP